MLPVESIASAVAEAIRTAACQLRPDVATALRDALATERSERGHAVIEQLLANADIAAAERLPICQDTGSVWVWVELGAEECPSGPLLPAVNAAVAEAYRDAGLRMSIARDALLDRSNTGDNTPAFLDITQREERGTRVHVMLKGGGSDNASAIAMLEPSAGEAGVARFVLDAVTTKATGACPPLLVGVGVGGTFDTVGKLAKKALLRPIHHGPTAVSFEHDRRGALEHRLRLAINDTGIGPAGLGGDTTALAVHIETAPCHIAAMPVAVNMGCCAVRSVSVDVS